MSTRAASRLAWSLCAVSVELFNPVRPQVQELLDRRFDRFRCDARRTMQPESIALWLRKAA